MEKIENKWHGDLTDDEWQELVTLEYVLTHGYSEDETADKARHKELSDKKWNSNYWKNYFKKAKNYGKGKYKTKD